MSRRDWLRAAGIGMVAGIAGCGASDTTDSTPDGEDEPEEPTSGGTDTPGSAVTLPSHDTAPQIAVECTLSGSNPAIVHDGGDRVLAENLELQYAGDGASFVEQSPPVYGPDDRIVEGESGDIYGDTRIVWSDPSGDESWVIAEC